MMLCMFSTNSMIAQINMMIEIYIQIPSFTFEIIHYMKVAVVLDCDELNMKYFLMSDPCLNLMRKNSCSSIYFLDFPFPSCW